MKIKCWIYLSLNLSFSRGGKMSCFITFHFSCSQYGEKCDAIIESSTLLQAEFFSFHDRIKLQYLVTRDN